MSWLNKPYSMLALTTIMIGLPVMFIAAIPWLKQQPESVVYLCAGIAATGTVVASFVLAIQKHQKFDEWHRPFLEPMGLARGRWDHRNFALFSCLAECDCCCFWKSRGRSRPG